MKTARRFLFPALLFAGSALPSEAQAQDNWLGADKVLHFVANIAITTASYSVAMTAWDMDQDEALALGVGISSAVSLAKELYDLHTDGLFSGRDLVWDALGMGTAVLLVRALDDRSSDAATGGAMTLRTLPLRALSRSSSIPGSRSSSLHGVRRMGTGAAFVRPLNPIDTPGGPFSLSFLRRKPPGD